MRPVTGGASLTAQVADVLRESILVGELRPGQLYSVSQLAEQLQVSRTPVREALLGLADTGVVRVERNRGFTVVRRDAQHIEDVFGVRLLLEVPAAALAAAAVDPLLTARLDEEIAAMRAAAADQDETRFMRHDRAFHEAVLDAAGNRVLTGVVTGLRDTITTMGASTVRRSRELADIAAEHEPIRAALRTGDAAGAAEAMRVHLARTRDLLMAQSADEAVPDR